MRTDTMHHRRELCSPGLLCSN